MPEKNNFSDLADALDAASREKDVSAEQAEILIEMANAFRDRRIGGLGIEALADFTLVLRASAALGPVKRWLWRLMAGFGALVVFWDQLRGRIMDLLGYGG